MVLYSERSRKRRQNLVKAESTRSKEREGREAEGRKNPPD